MNALEPRLQRLREIEVRLAFAEYHLDEQRLLCERLAKLGLENSLAHSLLRSMEDSIAILRLRQRDVLRGLQSSEPPPTQPDGDEPGVHGRPPRRG